jgi:uracil-DNA glycosylase
MNPQPRVLINAGTGLPEPPGDCDRCPRLAAFRAHQKRAHPDWFNAPVPAFGDPNAWLLIVGLAPGLQGANRTGRPFTGDYAGDLLYSTLLKFGLATGIYGADPKDGLKLHGCLISNSVRCVPPENKPTPEEARACRPYLEAQLTVLPKVKILLALGQIAHQAAIKVVGGKLPKYRFAHGAVHPVHTGYTIVDSYHCSRYNTNTGRLTEAMFETVFETALSLKP